MYKRKCDAPGHSEDIVSIYSADKPVIIYDQKYWWSDEWNPLQYGRDYDFSKPFFQQYKELFAGFPLQALSNSNATNSEYCNVADQSKDCYLISGSLENEGVLYSNRVAHNKDSSDLYVVHKSELCYDDILCRESYRLFYSLNSHNCNNSYFLYDCRNCSDCFGCSNLRNKKYHIFNKPHTKEDYQKKIKEFNLGSWKAISRFRDEFHKLYLQSLHRYAAILKSVDVIGDNVDYTKNCYWCFDITQGGEDNKYLHWGGLGLKDSYDCGPGVGIAELLYEVFDSGLQGSRLFATSVVYGSHNVQYAFNCYNSSNLFGCIGLRNKQYCILNKQYTKEEYEQLLSKVIAHLDEMPYINTNGRRYGYGEFFPAELSPFAYNETIAQDYFSLTPEQARDSGYTWKESGGKTTAITISYNELPDHISEVPDSMTQELIECAHEGKCHDSCTGVYKIIPQELALYRKLQIPLPRLCFNCRHYARLKQRNPLKLWSRTCTCAGEKSENGVYQNTIKHFHGESHCSNEFETTYAPDRPEIVYCEQCYQAEVV